MSTITIPASKVNDDLLAGAAKAGLDVIIVDDQAPSPSVEPVVEQAPVKAPVVHKAEPHNAFGIYADGWMRDRDKFLSLHPVITKGASGVHGSLELRAKLNVLPVVGLVKLSDRAWAALPKVMSQNGLVSKDTKANGKAVLRFYAPGITKAGKQNRKATQLLRDGCRIRLDCVHKTAKLVCGNGRAPKFGKGITAPLTRALKGMDIG